MTTTTATATATATEADNDDKKKSMKDKDVPLVHDQGFFRHDTGDVYDGYFEAKKKDRSVKMHGPGVYKTAEGDCYTGTWEFDKLSGTEEVVISFVDGSKYEGVFKDWSYNTHGKYTYPDGSLLECDFVQNCPVGHLKLTDPNGHTWLGKADQGFGWFEPVNHYYEFLEPARDRDQVNRLRRRHKNTQDVPVSSVSITSKQKSSVKKVQPSSGRLD